MKQFKRCEKDVKKKKQSQKQKQSKTMNIDKKRRRKLIWENDFPSRSLPDWVRERIKNLPKFDNMLFERMLIETFSARSMDFGLNPKYRFDLILKGELYGLCFFFLFIHCIVFGYPFS